MQIAASVGANGKVFAFDAVEERLSRLRENALRTELSNIEIRQADATSSTLAGLLPSSQLDAILAAGGMEKGDVMLIVADKNKVTLPTLGALRNILGKPGR